MTLVRASAIAALLSIAAASQAAFFTTEAGFGSAIATPSYTEDFSSATFGSIVGASYASPGANGYGWTASTTLLTGAAGGGLYSNVSSMSTNFSNQNLVFTFTGSPVKAFGARLANTNVNGTITAGTVTMTITGGDGGTQSVTLPASEGFIGYTSSTAITSVSVLATSATIANNWIRADHVITGTTSAVPEPATMAALGVGTLALLKRRRNAAK